MPIHTTRANFAPGSFLRRLSASCWPSCRRSRGSSWTLGKILGGFLAANATFPFARGRFLDWHRGRWSHLEGRRGAQMLQISPWIWASIAFLSAFRLLFAQMKRKLSARNGFVALFWLQTLPFA